MEGAERVDVAAAGARGGNGMRIAAGTGSTAAGCNAGATHGRGKRSERPAQGQAAAATWMVGLSIGAGR